MQITYTLQITVRQACTVGCQSKSQGTRYRLWLIVYDIVAVKIFDRYRDIVLSIRALLLCCWSLSMWTTKRLTVRLVQINKTQGYVPIGYSLLLVVFNRMVFGSLFAVS